jgi:hypothetical protein
VDADKETLAALFASRVALAKKSLAEAIEEITRDYENTKTWVASQSQKEGSFLWFCDVFELEPDAVRRAIKEKRK